MWICVLFLLTPEIKKRGGRGWSHPPSNGSESHGPRLTLTLRVHPPIPEGGKINGYSIVLVCGEFWALLIYIVFCMFCANSQECLVVFWEDTHLKGLYLVGPVPQCWFGLFSWSVVGGDESKSLDLGAGEGDVTSTKTPGRERAARWTKREGKSLWRVFFGSVWSYWELLVSKNITHNVIVPWNLRRQCRNHVIWEGYPTYGYFG